MLKVQLKLKLLLKCLSKIWLPLFPSSIHSNHWCEEICFYTLTAVQTEMELEKEIDRSPPGEPWSAQHLSLNGLYYHLSIQTSFFFLWQHLTFVKQLMHYRGSCGMQHCHLLEFHTCTLWHPWKNHLALLTRNHSFVRILQTLVAKPHGGLDLMCSTGVPNCYYNSSGFVLGSLGHWDPMEVCRAGLPMCAALFRIILLKIQK